jgi:hypothetical protein
MLISLTDQGPAIKMFDRSSKSGVVVIVKEDGSLLTLQGPDGKVRVGLLGTDKFRPHFIIYDRAGHVVFSQP